MTEALGQTSHAQFEAGPIFNLASHTNPSGIDKAPGGLDSDEQPAHLVIRQRCEIDLGNPREEGRGLPQDGEVFGHRNTVAERTDIRFWCVKTGGKRTNLPIC